ncbi:unnamed protein product [Prorocentrum cordatum]|uniref:Uncharacterized protein n=1 Tax=Prorocentrum cordatum TaxID=2364126 RepID=A0ABN9U3L9_9DINO|nr:unnamed protein product [Polarella glacialis]
MSLASNCGGQIIDHVPEVDFNLFHWHAVQGRKSTGACLSDVSNRVVLQGCARALAILARFKEAGLKVQGVDTLLTYQSSEAFQDSPFVHIYLAAQGTQCIQSAAAAEQGRRSMAASAAPPEEEAPLAPGRGPQLQSPRGRGRTRRALAAAGLAAAAGAFVAASSHTSKPIACRHR